MNLNGKKIGFALTGSFCTFLKVTEQIENLVKIELLLFLYNDLIFKKII